MKTGLVTKNEKFFIIVALVVGAGFFTVFKKVSFKSNASQFDAVEAINYNMARPEQGYSGYSLEGREVDAQYEAIQAKIKATKKMADLAKLKTVTKAAKKDVKKQAAVASAAKQGSANPFAGQSGLNTSNALVTSKPSSDRSLSGKTDSSVANHATTAQMAPIAVPPTTAAATDAAADDKSKTKTYAQWRTEIFAKPTKDTMGLFIAAYRKGEVTATEYQAMAQDLVDQSDASLKGLGLMALRSQPSLASLSQMVHAESTLSADLQAYVEAGYLSYFQAQNVQYLNAALLTSDKTLITKSLALLSTNLQKIKSGDVTSLVGSRNIRDAASVNLSIANFTTLLPALAKLTSSQSEYAGTAQQVSNLIQANSTAVASN
ncbi:MAG: hypothetical protein H7235_01920 [Bdellovibrionaceae bacterium]|nr:hypothetical protein [Pseudobdellovibrionaceae bacterium]MBC7457007.1 hypothetical protein [Pseudobdellovibrionaceae bacterium]